MISSLIQLFVGVESEMVSGSGILPYREQPVTFAFLTDLHVSPGSAGDTSLYRLVDEINQTNVDFTIVTGDLSNSGDFPKTLWAVNAGFGYEHNPCPVMATNDLVIAGTANGLLVAIDPKTRMIVWKYKAGNSLVNKVIVDQHQTFWFTLTEGKVLGIKSIF